MKKLIIALLLLILTGCSQEKPTDVQVVSTFYPLDQIVKSLSDSLTSSNLVGEKEIHGFQPSVKDVMMMESADLIFIVDKNLENFTQDLSNLNIVELNSNIDLIKTSDEHEDQDEHDEHDEHDHGGTDPHTWMSPKQLMTFTSLVKDQLINKYPDLKSEIENNYNEFITELSNINDRYLDLKDSCELKTTLISHDFIAYIAKDYDLKFQNIHGLNPHDKLSIKNFVDLNNSVQKNKIESIIYAEGELDKNVETLAQTNNLDLVPIYSMERSVNNLNLLQLLDENLESLKTAFKCQ